MRLLAALVLITGCPSTKPSATTRPQPPGTTPDSAASLAPAPSATVHAPRQAVEAPHAGQIQLLTATPDATAVLSIDELGGARLWPTLDGTQEPRIVELPAGKELALGRHGAGFAAVVLDESGGLYVAKLDREARTLSHTTHGNDPAFIGIVMSSLGVVAWRSDHHVLLIDGDGAIKGQLATEPQQRVIDVAAAGARAVAILDRAGTRQARWLVLQPKLAWGDWIPKPLLGAEAGTSIALAPDHKHFAMGIESEKHQRVVIGKTATGSQVTSRDFPALTPLDVKFADATTLAVASASGLTWLSVNADPIGEPAANPPTTFLRNQRKILAAGGGRAIVPGHGHLVLMKPISTEFLGYGVLVPRIAAPAATGQLVIDTGHGLQLLDSSLRGVGSRDPGIKPPYPSWVAPDNVAELIWVGGDDWLIESGNRDGKAQVALVDVVKGTQTIVRSGLTEAHVLGYEPSTQLATLSFGPAAEVAEVKLPGRTLDRVVAAPTRTGPFEQTLFVPLAPKLARGHKLLYISLRDKPTVRWIADPRTLDKPTATLTLDGAYAAADAAGHVYAWRAGRDGKAQLAVFTDGKETATLPVTQPSLLWPDPTGTRVLEIAQNTLTLYEPSGTTLWSRDVTGAQDALWLSDGGLAITHSSGIARLDPKTGAITAARCGWSFGLSAKPLPSSPRIESICVQLLR